MIKIKKNYSLSFIFYAFILFLTIITGVFFYRYFFFRKIKQIPKEKDLKTEIIYKEENEKNSQKENQNIYSKIIFDNITKKRIKEQKYNSEGDIQNEIIYHPKTEKIIEKRQFNNNQNKDKIVVIEYFDPESGEFIGLSYFINGKKQNYFNK
jgi:uncharacterized protein YneF (UPF0154 family)